MSSGGSVRERLDDHLHALAAMGGDAILVLKSGSPPRVSATSGVQDLAGEPLGKAELAHLAEAILQPTAADQLVERRHIELAYGIDGLGRFRVTAYSQRGSLALQFRLVCEEAPSLEDLGLPRGIAVLAKQRGGLVVVSGPPGSGRTTTLHAIIDYVNRTAKRFVATVEEPIEILHRDQHGLVVQLEVGLDVPSTAAGVRRAVRQGASVIMVGAVADREVAAACLGAAESGRLVLAGVEATSVVGAVGALVELFDPQHQDRLRLRLAGVLAGVVNQHLLPRRSGTGHVVAAEVRFATSQVLEEVLHGHTGTGPQDSIATAGGEGTQTLEEALADLLAAGVIDLRAAFVVAPSWELLRRRLEQHGVDTAAFAGRERAV